MLSGKSRCCTTSITRNPHPIRFDMAKRQKLDLVERARAVHRSKMYLVLYQGSLLPEGLQSLAVAHIVDGAVDALCYYEWTKPGPALFEREAATHTFANLTLGDAVELGARLLGSQIRPGRSYDQLCLGIGLYVRRAGEADAKCCEYSLQHCCPDARRVLYVELNWDSFEGLASTIGEDGVVIRHDQRQRVVIRHDQYAAAMGRAVSTLALAIRTYEPARSSEWVTCT